MNSHEPGLVTAIVASPRAPARFDILIDGRPLATLGFEAIERLGLHVGAPVADRLARIEREAATLRAYDRALAMLAARARSSRDLEQLLVRKGEPPELARAAIARLQAAGFLDDATFARQFVRSKSLGAGMARRRLRQELTRRGVDRSVADAAVSEILTEEGVDERDAAESLARRRLRSLRNADAPTCRRRLYAYLARRGYDSEVIARVLERVLADA